MEKSTVISIIITLLGIFSGYLFFKIPGFQWELHTPLLLVSIAALFPVLLPVLSFWNDQFKK